MSSNLASFQKEIQNSGLSAFVIPRTDAHGGENIAPRDERLRWLTGFTGSAGLCAATASKAAVFVDGRYRLQARREVNLQVIEIRNVRSDSLSQWMKEALPNGGLVGYDPWLHTQKEIEGHQSGLEGTKIQLLSSGNLVDRIWTNQPAAPVGDVFPHEIEFAGETHLAKRSRIADQIRKKGCSATVVTLGDCICWLLNIRGSDVSLAPIVHAFAILWAENHVDLFIDQSKFHARTGQLVLEELGHDIRIRPVSDFGTALSGMKDTVLADPGSCAAWIFERLKESGATVLRERDPCILAKALKNTREIECSSEAHIRDGVAMAEFLAWLQIHGSRGITEMDVVKKSREFRERTGSLHDMSFDTIAASGPNGAIVHYRATPYTNRVVAPECPLLIDSGAQYKDGTTDVTRTISLACMDPEVKRCFTLVLKGLIAIARAQWPDGLTGRDLDSIARYPLWLAGKDYDHGTGHGVGHFLNVHEGPQAISHRAEEPLRPGMVISLEPGYYRENKFGIRLENLALVERAQKSREGGHCKMLRFRNLTFVPIQKQLILKSELVPDEVSWLNSYHSETFSKIAPHCSKATREWLHEECSPL